MGWRVRGPVKRPAPAALFQLHRAISKQVNAPKSGLCAASRQKNNTKTKELSYLFSWLIPPIINAGFLALFLAPIGQCLGGIEKGGHGEWPPSGCPLGAGF